MRPQMGLPFRLLERGLQKGPGLEPPSGDPSSPSLPSPPLPGQLLTPEKLPPPHSLLLITSGRAPRGARSSCGVSELLWGLRGPPWPSRGADPKHTPPVNLERKDLGQSRLPGLPSLRQGLLLAVSSLTCCHFSCRDWQS